MASLVGDERFGEASTFPLVQRHRLLGLAFGTFRSGRRGLGSDVAGSRPYRSGDDVAAIDWAASARLSSAVDRDEFVVRERFAEEAPRVVVVSDLSPGMALFPDDLPWLRKHVATSVARELVAASAYRLQGFVGSLDTRGAPESWQRPKGRTSRRGELPPVARHDAPADGLAAALEELGRRPAEVPAGTFVFVLSDFLADQDDALWVALLGRRLDVVPVVIQDPVWEQSFPEVGGASVPVADPATGRVGTLRLTRREAAARRAANEGRLARLLARFVRLGLDPIVLGTSDREAIHAAFLAWAVEREEAPDQGLRPWA